MEVLVLVREDLWVHNINKICLSLHWLYGEKLRTFVSLYRYFMRPTNFYSNGYTNEHHRYHKSHQISNFWRYLWSVASKCNYKMKQPKLYKMLKSLILLAHIFSQFVSLFLSHEYNYCVHICAIYRQKNAIVFCRKALSEDVQINAFYKLHL